MFKVAIIGAEGTKNYDFFKEKCIFFLKNKAKEGCGIIINTTGDEFVENFAKIYGINTRTFYTDWKKYGKKALIVRDNELIDDSDALIYFNDGIKDNKIIYDMAKTKNLPSRKVDF